VDPTAGAEERVVEQGGMTGPFRTLIVVASLVVVVLGMRAAAPVVNMILLTLLFAIIASPYVELLMRRGLGRGAAVGVAVLTVAVLGIVLILLVWSTLPRLTAKIPIYGDLLEQRAAGAAIVLERLGIDGGSLLSSEVLSPSRLAALARRLVGAATTSVLQGILLLLLTVFFMIDMEVYRKRGSGGSVIAEYVANARDVRRYLSITGLTGLLAGACNVVLLVALGVDFPVLWGVLSFVTNFIPNVGFFVALVPPVLVALIELGPLRAILVVVGYFLINLIMDSVLKPRFLQKGIGITPFETLISLVFWSWVLGPTGAILAVPLTLLVKSNVKLPIGSAAAARDRG
jgi:AI-2 transport protein TqsA